MSKTTYKYKQVQIPEEAKKHIDDAYEALNDKTIRKADLWVHATAWISEQVSTNGYENILKADK